MRLGQSGLKRGVSWVFAVNCDVLFFGFANLRASDPRGVERRVVCMFEMLDACLGWGCLWLLPRSSPG